LIAGRKNNCQNRLGQSEKAGPTLFRIDQERPPPLPELGQLPAPPFGDNSSALTPPHRLAQLWPASQSVELGGTESKVGWVNRLKSCEQVDGCEGRIVRCPIGRRQPDPRNQRIRIFSIARGVGDEGCAGESHARGRALTQPGQDRSRVEPGRADLFERRIASPANREIGSFE
jgi:hypothetical protein